MMDRPERVEKGSRPRFTAEIELQARLQAAEDELERTREALRAIVERHGDHFPMGSWVNPGHNVIAAEWERARAALRSEGTDGA